jgi:hypothetical protein
MKLSDHSQNRLLHTFSLWDVEQEYSQHVSDYLVNGWHPGSFYTAVFANDFVSAMVSSHPGNRIDPLKNLAGWMLNHMPVQARGSYDAVGTWLRMSPEDRRTALEQADLIYDTKTEMWLVLKNEHTSDPYDYTV